MNRKGWAGTLFALAVMCAAFFLFGGETALRMGLMLALIGALFLFSRRKPVHALAHRNSFPIKNTDVGLKQTKFCNVAANEEALESL